MSRNLASRTRLRLRDQGRGGGSSCVAGRSSGARVSSNKCVSHPPEQVAACESMREFLYNVDFTDKFWTPVDAASRFCDHFADGQSGTA